MCEARVGVHVSEYICHWNRQILLLHDQNTHTCVKISQMQWQYSHSTWSLQKILELDRKTSSDITSISYIMLSKIHQDYNPHIAGYITLQTDKKCITENENKWAFVRTDQTRNQTQKHTHTTNRS